MGVTVAPAARQALKDATSTWKGRNKASDGLLPSPEHLKQSPNSDHNTGDAVDITHDPAHGADGNTIAAWAIRDPRVKYVIWNGRKYTKGKGGWRKYNGKNKHSHHVHISLKHAARADTSPWGWATGKPTPPISIPGETTFESIANPGKGTATKKTASKAAPKKKTSVKKKAKTTRKAERTPTGKHVYNGEPTVTLGVYQRMMAHVEAPHTGGGKIAEGNPTILVGRQQLMASRVGDKTTDNLKVKTGQENVFLA